MKILYFKRALLTLFAIVSLTSLYAQPDHVYLIGGPVNKHNPNWLLEDKIELTKDEVNPAIFYFKGYLSYNWRGDERGNIKFLISDSWTDAFHPDNDVNELLSGTTSMSQDSRDTKWFIPDDRSGDGYYELTLNTDLMTLTVDVFRADPNPEEIYIVGESMPCGWDNNNPEVMVREDPEVAIYKWSGVMNSGDFKFLHPLSIGNWDFGYTASTPNEQVTIDVAQDVIFEVRGADGITFNDYKFYKNEVAECTITVDLVSKTMIVTKNGETSALDLWITGTAIPGGIAKLVSDNIDPNTNYHYYGELLTGEFKFCTTENIDETTQYYVPVSSSDAISENISVNLTSDANVVGWSVTQPNEMYKIKFNSLSKNYNGNIFNIDNVYIVGGATAVGWDAGNAIELTRGTGNETYVFTFEGNLIINTEIADGDKFKFLLQRDWNPYSLHPQFENELITEAQYITEKHSVDFKWAVDENKQGHYTIKLDVLEETIEAIYDPNHTSSITKKEGQTKVYSTKGKIIIKSTAEKCKSIEVYDLSGARVCQKLSVKNTEMEITKGIYIVKITYNDHSTKIKKVSVQ